jgi:hypothetical protein
MWKSVESVVVRCELGLWPLRFVWRSSWSRFQVGWNSVEANYANAFAQCTVRRLKFADRTFSAERRERFANRSGSSRDAANAAPSVR